MPLLIPAMVLAGPFTFDPAVGELNLPALAAMEEAPQQAADTEPVPGFGQVDAMSRATRITFNAQYAHLFNSEVDDNQGEFNLDRLRLQLKGLTPLNDTWELSYGFKYQFDGFNFEETGLFGADPEPWTDIHTVQFNIGAVVKLTEQWRGFFGGQFRFSRETGADWGDSFEGGGAFGASYSFDKDLTIGGGLGIESQLEDSLLYYPIIVVDWQIAPRWSVNTRITSGWGDSAGVQLIYDWTDTVQLALGANYDYQRFRLNDESPMPGGVGHFTALPIYLRLSWNPMPAVQLSGFVGANVGGELESKNQHGHRVGKRDYGTGFLVGGQVSVTF